MGFRDLPGPTDTENSRQEPEKDCSHPRCHAVCLRRTEIPVDDDDRDEDGDDVHDEREEKVLGDERNVVGRGRQNF